MKITGLITVIWLLVKAIGFITNPIFVVIAATGLLYKAWQENWFGIRNIALNVWEDIKDIWGKVENGLDVAVNWSKEKMTPIWTWIKETLIPWTENTAIPGIKLGFSFVWNEGKKLFDHLFRSEEKAKEMNMKMALSGEGKVKEGLVWRLLDKGSQTISFGMKWIKEKGNISWEWINDTLIPWTKEKGLQVKTKFNATVNWVKDVSKAFKKGVEQGDWSDFKEIGISFSFDASNLIFGEGTQNLLKNARKQVDGLREKMMKSDFGSYKLMSNFIEGALGDEETSPALKIGMQIGQAIWEGIRLVWSTANLLTSLMNNLFVEAGNAFMKLGGNIASQIWQGMRDFFSVRNLMDIIKGEGGGGAGGPEDKKDNKEGILGGLLNTGNGYIRNNNIGFVAYDKMMENDKPTFGKNAMNSTYSPYVNNGGNGIPDKYMKPSNSIVINNIGKDNMMDMGNSSFYKYEELKRFIEEELGIVDWSGNRSYSSGGYTGTGNVNDIAGYVHKGEYVIPKRMVKDNPGLIASLDEKRRRGFRGRR